MDNPYRIVNNEYLTKKRFLSEPDDLFTENLRPSEGKDYHLSEVIVLTVKSEEHPRIERFMRENKNSGFIFKTHQGKSGTPVSDFIFDNYLEILEKELSESEFVCVCEDDVFFCEGAKDHIEKSMRQLPKDWEILSGNYSFLEKIIKVSENLIESNSNSSSFNFTIFHRRSLEKIKSKLHLRDLEKPNLFRHIDRFCFNDATEMSSYCVWPMVCRELPGFSHTANKVRNVFELKMENKPYIYRFIDKPEFKID